jgi:hypothetical protein
MTTSSSRRPEQFSAQVPFAGFYGSWHQQLIDDAEEQLFQGDSGDVDHPDLYKMFWSHLPDSVVRERYARQFVAELAKSIGIPLEFEEMVSPREYNFQTDRVFAKVSRADLAKMLRAVRGSRLNAEIRERFTSCSGFCSSYPNSISRWPRIADWDHNHVGTVLACYVQKLRDEGDAPSEEDLVSEWNSGDCMVEGWLADAATGPSARALRINDYLRQRAERKYRPLAIAS